MFTVKDLVFKYPKNVEDTIKGIDFEIDKDNGSIKIVEKKELGQLNVARAQN